MAGCSTPEDRRRSRELSYPDAGLACRRRRGRGRVQRRGVRESRTLLLVHGLGSYMPVWTAQRGRARRRPRGHHRPAGLRQVGRRQLRVLDGVLRPHRRPRHRHARLQARGARRPLDGRTDRADARLRYPGKAKALVLVAPAGLRAFGRGEGTWLAEAVDKATWRARRPRPSTSTCVELLSHAGRGALHGRRSPARHRRARLRRLQPTPSRARSPRWCMGR